MDWSKVKKEHVDLAIKKFIEEKPEHTKPRSYYLLYKGEKLPSKFIRGMAYSIATGEELSLSGFSGGTETVNFFKKYGYEVEQVTGDDSEDKYSVYDVVWVATALLAIKQFTSNPDVTREDMYFKQSDIVKEAQSLINSKVDPARVSMWVNADNKNHIYNYLRADSEINPTKRRLSLIGEFPDKTYPIDLDMSDVFDIGESQITMEELFTFVKEQYPNVIRKTTTISIDYIGLLNYLNNYQEIPYSSPEATEVNPAEKDKLFKIREKGQSAVAEMTKLALRCKELFGLDKDMPITWLDGSNTKTKKYLSVQLKYKPFVSNPASVSIFVEKDNNVLRYRISLDIKNDDADKKMMEAYHSHLDIPKKDGMAYVYGSNEWGNPEVITDTADEIKAKIDSGDLRKVQICVYVEYTDEKTNGQYDAEVMAAVKQIIPYYEYVIGKVITPSTGRAWLLTWNPANWTWADYKAWCKDTKLGNKFVVPWSCASKQPAVGDEIFLIKTGSKPRGIIAHGYVVKGAYETDHYDPEKAATGVKSNHIDAEYDWIQDYDTEPILMQDYLKNMFPDQQWSPMGSGIEIKSSVLPELKKMWLELIGKRAEEAIYWPSLEEYDPGITKEKWVELLNDSYVTNGDNLRMFKMILELNGESTCANLAEIYGGSAGSYNNWGRIFGERVHRKTNCQLYVDGDRQRYYTIPFLGRYVIEKGKRRYSWKFRSELEEALKEMDLSYIDLTLKEESVIAYDKNMILYGPPGTGKTYSTAIYAVAICDQLNLNSVKAMDYNEVMVRYRELLTAGRVAFTTFHQSYGYEEFIEGIKPVLDSGSNIGYTIEDGVFKKFCDDAHKPENNDIQCFGDLWAVRNRAGDSDVPFNYEDYLYKNGVIMVETNDENDKRQCNMISRMKKGDWVVLGRERNIAALGVIDDEEVSEINCEPFHWKRKVNWLVTGLSATFSDIGIVGGCFSNFAIAKSKHKVQNFYKLINTENKIVKPYVFVIDEINRGNISKIFGELITLIEDTKREGMDEQAAAVLPYSGVSFSVPDNVYILGTMNTADRSIALMDTALRRRFQFVEMMPDADVLRDIGADKVDDLDVAAMLEKINERITFLYDREHTIGHAFFTKLAKEPTIENLKAIFKKSVIPLLQEYFYEDYQKIQLVLGDNGKTDPSTKFILDEEVKVKNIFKGNADDVVDLPDKKYTINAAAFDNLESYKQII